MNKPLTRVPEIVQTSAVKRQNFDLLYSRMSTLLLDTADKKLCMQSRLE